MVSGRCMNDKRRKYSIFVLSVIITLVFIGCGTIPHLPEEDTYSYRTQLRGHYDQVVTVDVNSTVGYAVSGSLDNNVYLWNLKTNSEINIIEDIPDDIFTVAIRPDGMLYAVGARDMMTRIYEFGNVEPAFILQDHMDSVYSVAFSQDNKYFASGGLDRSIVLYDQEEEFKKVNVLRGHDDKIIAIKFSRDGKYIFSGGERGELRVWDVSNSENIETVELDAKKPIYDIAVSPSGEYIAISSVRRDVGQEVFHTVEYPVSIYRWENNELTLIRNLLKHKKPAWALAFTPDGKYLVSGGKDKKIIWWSLDRYQNVHEKKSEFGAIWDMAFTEDGQKLYVACEERAVVVYERLK